jgi:hypothetical protein
MFIASPFFYSQNKPRSVLQAKSTYVPYLKYGSRAGLGHASDCSIAKTSVDCFRNFGFLNNLQPLSRSLPPQIQNALALLDQAV